MMLALAIVVCLLATAAAAVAAARLPRRTAWLWTLAAVLVPLGGLGVLAGRTPPAEPAFRAQVVGQYFPLLDTVRVGSTAAADVGIPAGGAGVALRVAYDLRASALRLHVDSGTAPVLAGDVPVNALPLGRAATIRVGGARPLEIRSSMPRWPVGCLVRLERWCGDRVWHVSAAGRQRSLRVRVTEAGASGAALRDPLLSSAPFVLFRHGARAYLAASPSAPVTVNGRAVPARASVAAPAALQVGLRRAAVRAELVPDRQSNRLLVRFTRGLSSETWGLAVAGPRTVYRVTSGAATTPAGTLPLLDLGDDVPLGPRARAYDGALEWTARGWRWHGAGQVRAVPSAGELLLPGSSVVGGDRGHLLRVSPRPLPSGPVPVLAVVWLLGAVLLATNATRASQAAPWFRVAALGCVYTVVLVRTVLAVRVSQAPPYSSESIPTTLIFLAACPALVWLLERWATLPGLGLSAAIAARGGPADRRWMPRESWAATAAALFVLVGAIAAGSMADTGWRAVSTERALFVAVVLMAGTLGVLALHGVLIAAPARGAAREAPLGLLVPRSEQGFGQRHLIRTVAALMVLVTLYISLALSLRGVAPPLSGLLYLVVVGAAYAVVGMRERVRPRLRPRRHAAWVAAAAGGALLLTPFALGAARPQTSVLLLVVAALAMATLAAAATWWTLLPLVQPLRAFPYRRADILPPPVFALLPAFLLFAAPAFPVSRLAITLGFALACAGLLLVVRVITVLWYRQTRGRTAAQMPERAGAAAVRRPGARTVLTSVLLALSVYAGYLAADRGLVLLLFTSVLVTVVIGAATLGARWLAGASALLVVVVASIAWYLQAPTAALAAHETSLSTPQMRFAAVWHPESLEQQLLFSRPAQAREIVSTLQQDWGMRSFAALGETWGPGLYGVPYSPRAISPEVALTDNVFAVFVLGEHGFAGGVAVLAAYVALALVLLAAAAVAARRFGEVYRAILLGGLATYVAIPALYMAAANVSLLPLTGQNLPLLGLRSGADAAFASWLVALALIALPAAGAGQRGTMVETEVNRRAMRLVRTVLAWTGAALVAGAIGVSVALHQATHRTVQPFALASLGTTLRTVVDRGDLHVVGDSIAVAALAEDKPGFGEGQFLRELVARSNAAGSRADDRAHCLDRGPWLARSGAGTVRVLDVACRIDFPTADAGWRGTLASSAARGAEWLVAGGHRTMALADVGAPGTAVACADTGALRARGFDLACSPDGARLLLRALPDGASAQASGGGSVTLNGAPLDGRPLAMGDILAVDSAVTLVVDSAPRGTYGYARWRNGEFVRVSPSGGSALLSRLDTLLARGLRSDSTVASARVRLTLDAALGEALQSALAERCAAAAGGALRQCAVTIVDPETGDVLALASWERPGLTVRAYQPLDANFRNHRGASAVKPLIASAVLARYPRLRTLAVDHPGEQFAAAAGWTISAERPFRSELHGCTSPVGWECFLPGSNNLYAVTLGLLGLAVDGGGPMPAVRGAAVGPAFFVDGRAVTARPQLPARHAMAASPLAGNLVKLFDASIGRRSGQFDTTLWAPMRERGLLPKLPAGWQRVSPEPVQLPLDDPQFADLRHVAGFLIGETDNAWSNVALSRSMSRIMTGRRVQLRLVRGVGEVALAPARAESLAFGPGRAAVLDGMRGVVRDGTAARVNGLFATSRVDFFGKTGTAETRGPGTGLTPVSVFLFGGRARDGATRMCAAAGTVFVEAEPNAAGRLPAVDLFAEVVAPVLRERLGWGETSCQVRS
jgi:cell division protein FtsW (lipid II flippase)